MEGNPVKLKPADEIEIVTLMDNYSDVLLQSSGPVTRPPLAPGGEIPTDTLLAEHGLSQLVRLKSQGTSHSILFDTGYSPVGVLHNLKILNIDLQEVEALILSHGHMDHTGSLYPILEHLHRNLPLVVHPEAFLSSRYIDAGEGKKLFFPRTLNRRKLESLGAEILESRAPVSLCDDSLLVTGQVERTTSFEKGFPNAFLSRDGKEKPDAILDDQSLVIHLKDKGLVIISGCAHAGIVNTVQYARKLTGVKTIHGIIGGFHLSGPAFEPIIDQTIDALGEMAPQVIVPMHCTGWKAIERFSRAFPSSFVLNSVGSSFKLN
ncbi:metallo-beta-lactamase domain protein [delta proteobacterium NaphS2]|nr:metallo-beta-lactamase domain protein [delta proteobacterium NaphS2]